MNNEKTPTKATFNRRRIGAAGLLAATTFGLFQVGSEIKRSIDDVRAAETFSQPNLAEHLGEQKINPNDVLVHVIKAGENNPTEVATAIGARDPVFVAGEIAGQVGGSHSMNIGETIVIPLNQLQK